MLDLESLKRSDLPTLELRKQLLTINGVGPYAAANLLLLLGRSDFIPIDSYALKMVSLEWYGGEPVTAKEVEQRFEKWGKFIGARSLRRLAPQNLGPARSLSELYLR